ncbi:MAG TPA: vanadium-dependent haloperoxidase [Tepidisphaeraceae bacterium]|nr:vanadium-dependent haloperoxidase [Tepidisphaeraceae bacterium]
MKTATPLRALELCELLEPRVLFAHAPDIVIEWNRVLIDALRADRTLGGPTWASRNAAIVHAAIFDAVNSIEQRYEPYLVSLSAAKHTSIVAAAAAAGWRTLSAIYPDQQSMLDDALTKSLARVKDGPRESNGVALGIAVANQILAARANDGSDDATPYTPGSDPGDWQPTPLDYSTALGANWGKVKPFALDDPDQLLPPPPPALDSAEYAAAFNQVKSLGELNSATRTAEQTEIGIFWGYDRAGMGAPPSLYNQIAESIAIGQHNTTVENARLFALLNISQADAGVVAWACKYKDNFWRPITAIRAAATDGNPNTQVDPNWEPLGASGGGVVPNFTPPFPAYISGHATFGGAVFQILADFYGRDRFQFTAKSEELPGVTRSFNSFSAAAAENGISRIYLGIHWSFDNLRGQEVGRNVANEVFAHDLRPVRHDHQVLPAHLTFKLLSLGHKEAYLLGASSSDSLSF